MQKNFYQKFLLRKVNFYSLSSRKKNIIDHRFKYNLEDYKKIKFLGLEGIALPDNYYLDLIKYLKKVSKTVFYNFE